MSRLEILTDWEWKQYRRIERDVWEAVHHSPRRLSNYIYHDTKIHANLTIVDSGYVMRDEINIVVGPCIPQL